LPSTRVVFSNGRRSHRHGDGGRRSAGILAQTPAGALKDRIRAKQAAMVAAAVVVTGELALVN
jgi:hypothetical protein